MLTDTNSSCDGDVPIRHESSCLSPQREGKHGRKRDVCENMDDVVSVELKDQVRERRDDVTRGAWAERNYKYHLGVQSWLFSGSRCTTNSVALRCRSFRLLAVGQVFFRAFYKNICTECNMKRAFFLSYKPEPGISGAIARTRRRNLALG